MSMPSSHRKVKQWPGNIDTQEVDFAEEMTVLWIIVFFFVAYCHIDIVVLLFKTGYGLKFWQAICLDSPSKRGKENTLDQGEDVKYSDAAKQDKDGAAAVNENDAKGKGKAARGYRRVKERRVESREVGLELPLPRAPLAAEDVGNALQFFFLPLKSPKLNLFFENYRVEEMDVVDGLDRLHCSFS
ncbi:hypothetical protein DVH24_015858 [Malus domestica]|uniref:Uncharacterized protein n=1 Tax=Malus domestica TaxID=3750 RepID=A0A498JKD3_MALDO|nr:hypothetical protein DVH24_015858 [Malus domestica]